MSSETKAAIKVTINGETREVPSGLTVAALLGHLEIDGRVAIERNRDILPRAQWQETLVCSGDTYEIVQFVGGG